MMRPEQLSLSLGWKFIKTENGGSIVGILGKIPVTLLWLLIISIWTNMGIHIKALPHSIRPLKKWSDLLQPKTRNSMSFLKFISQRLLFWGYFMESAVLKEKLHIYFQMKSSYFFRCCVTSWTSSSVEPSFTSNIKKFPGLKNPKHCWLYFPSILVNFGAKVK